VGVEITDFGLPIADVRETLDYNETQGDFDRDRQSATNRWVVS